MESAGQSPKHGGVFRDQLQVHGLVAAALAYPVYSFIDRNPVYLVANRVSPGQLVWLIALVSLLAPFALSGVLLVVRRLSHSLYAACHFCLSIPLVMICLLPMFNEADSLSLWIPAAACSVGAALIVRESRTNTFVYHGIVLLSLLAPIFVIRFVADSHVRHVLFPPNAQASGWIAEADDSLPTVVVVVFDEFPMVHLLDANGGIDGKRFPNFSRFGDQATWYMNGTTVHDQTMKAVPAILTGTYPVQELRLPSAQSYPDSMFNLLRGTHQMHVREQVTHLYTEVVGTKSDYAIGSRAFFSDLGIFYARGLMPVGPANQWLPIQNGIWGGFLANMPAPDEAEDRDALNEWIDEDRERERANDQYGNRYHMVQEYIAEMGDFPKNTLHYVHVMLPHGPYSFLPSGKSYNASEPISMDAIEEVRYRRQAHILQVGLADTVLGELQEELTRLGRWDDAMVVVVGDHGEGYEAEKHRRILTQSNFGSMAFVPLIIKYPSQLGGRVDAGNAQSIDILPTMLDVLGVEHAPRLDGISLRNPRRSVRDMTRVLSDSGEVYEYSEAVSRVARSKAHREAVEFFSLDQSNTSLFQRGPGLDLLGSPIKSHRDRWIPSQLGLHSANDLRSVDLQADLLPAQVNGEIVQMQGELPENAVVAVAVNEVIRGVAHPYLASDGKYRFWTVLPEEYLEATNAVEAAFLRTDL